MPCVCLLMFVYYDSVWFIKSANGRIRVLQRADYIECTGLNYSDHEPVF